MKYTDLDVEGKRELLKKMIINQVKPTKHDIAIIGISGRYPGAENLTEFWDNLKNGVDSVVEIPKERWDYRDFYTEDRSDITRSYAKTGGFLTDVYSFDPLFFNISPRDVKFIDPQERIMLESVWSALENASVTRQSLEKINGKVGVYIGIMGHDYEWMGGYNSGRKEENGYYSSSWSVSNRISYFLNAKGPSMAVDTACSSSLTAVHLACESLERGECKVAIAGGVNLILHPAHYIKYSGIGMLSKNGVCSAFGSDADGFADAEGVGTIILKPLEAAIADKNVIHGVIKATAVNSCGATSGFTVPSPSAQCDVVTEAIKKAGVNPENINYYEAHGTGTQLGDPIEIEGLTHAFRRFTNKEHFCAIGSIKSNIGHAESAAGMSAIAKILLQFKHKKLVPSLHCQEINPKIRIEHSPFFVQRELADWNVVDTASQKRLAGISSFGAGGSNACVILEEYIPEKTIVEKQEEKQLVLLSAKNKDRLKTYIKELYEYITESQQRSKAFSILAQAADISEMDISEKDCFGDLGLGAVELEAVSRKLAEIYQTNVSMEVLSNFDTVGTLVQKFQEGQKEGNFDFVSFIENLKYGREAHEERIVMIASNIQEVKKALGTYLQDETCERLYANHVKSRDAKAFRKLHEKEMLNGVKESNLTLEEVAVFWVNGIKVEWEEKNSFSHMELPTYPFEKMFFIPKITFSDAINSNLQERFTWLKKNYVEANFYTEQEKSIKDKRVLLLVNGDTKIIENLADKVWKNCQIVTVRNKLELEESNVVPDIMIDLMDVVAEEGIKEIVKDRIEILQYIIKNAKNSIALFHITSYLFGPESAQHSMCGAVMHGFYQVIGCEYAKVSSRNIDIDYETCGLEECLRYVRKEFANKCLDKEVCYRNGKRYIAQFKEQVLEESMKDTVFDEESVVLITGAFGGIGNQIIQDAVSKRIKKLALVGHTKISPREKWQQILEQNPGKKEAQVIREILELEQNGVQVEVYSGSIIEQEKMQKFIERVHEKLGKIAIVYHCAGYSGGQEPAFIKKAYEEIEKVLEPKVAGLQMLDSCIPESCYVVLFSSISAVLPQYGVSLSDYATANHYLDLYAHHYRGNKEYVSINWPLWNGVGMGGDEHSVFQVQSVNTEEGISILENIVKNGITGAIIPLQLTKEFTLDDVNGFMKETKLQKKAVKVLPKKETQIVFADLQHLKQQLREQFIIELELTDDIIDDDTEFGEYGVDSVLIGSLVSRLEKVLSITMDPGLFMENPTLNLLAEALYPQVLDHEEAKEEIEKAECEQQVVNKEVNVQDVSSYRDKIAVIGMACHFPKAENKEQFWESLSFGRDCITEIPPMRWDKEYFYSEALIPGKTISKWGGFIDGIDYFDPEYFHLTKDEAPFIDPLIRQLLEVTNESIADAGYEKKELSGKNIGVFVGTRAGSYSKRYTQMKKGSLSGVGQNFIAAHISQCFNLKGPNMVVDSACSSSLVTIHLAKQSLLLGETEYAIAAGVDILLDEESYLVLSQSNALSPDGKCHTFDVKANGFVPGEGCGVVLLKRLDRAVQDKDKIYAVIDASAVNNDGCTMGITTPNPQTQAEVIKEAIERANIDIKTVGLLEAHGTGTMIGDPIELKALTKVYEEKNALRGSCAIGSVKTNIGHLLSAAGIASFIKVVMAIEKKQIPPTLNCETLNPRFNFEQSPFYPALKLEDWIREDNIRRAGISSFGFGGTNAHLIVSNKEGILPEDYKAVNREALKVKYHKKRYWLEKVPNHQINKGIIDSHLMSLEVEMKDNVLKNFLDK